MKKSFILAIFISFTIVIGICLLIFQLNTPRFDLPEVLFEDAESSMQARGFTKKVTAPHAVYYIVDGLLDDALKQIRQCEILLDIAKKEYGFKPDSNLRIFLSNEEATKLYGGRSLSIDPTDINSRGQLFCGISEKKLPYWVCAGIETYWLSHYKEIKPNLLSKSKILKWAEENQSAYKPSFGDAWFIPDFIESTDIETAQDISYALIHNLQINKQIAEFINNAQDEYEMQIFLNDAVSQFFGCDLVAAERFLVWKSIDDFKVLTSQCKYTFDYENAQYGYVNKLVSQIDEGILYAKDFLDIDYDGYLDIEFQFSDQDFGALYGGFTDFGSSKIKIFDSTEPASIAVHEAVHALDGLSWGTGIIADPTFREGMALLVQGNYSSDAKTDSYHARLAEYLDYLEGNADEETRKLYEMYETMMGDAVSTEEIDVFVVRDAGAYLELQDPDYLRASIGNNRSILSENDTYRQASSFFEFLYRRYGIEKIKEVYFNKSLAEKEFGTTIEDLVSQWKAHLSQMAHDSR